MKVSKCLAPTMIALIFSSLVSASTEVKPCKVVLDSTAEQWIEQYTQKNGNNTLAKVKAILRYEHCFNEALKTRKVVLDRSGKGPLMGAMGNYRDFQNALKDFTHIAIRACGQSGDRVRIQRAYAYLYQLRFQDLFYRQFETDNNNTQAIDTKTLNRLKQQLTNLLKQQHPHDTELLTNRFEKLLTLAKEIGLPVEYIYDYALLVVNQEGEIRTEL